MPNIKEKDTTTFKGALHRSAFQEAIIANTSVSSVIESTPRLQKWFTIYGRLSHYIDNSIERGILKPAQLEVLKSIKDFLFERKVMGTKKAENRPTNDFDIRGFVELPTGFGKTVIFSQVIKALYDKSALETAHKINGKELRVVIVVPTVLLVTQTRDRINQFAPELTNEIGVVYSGESRVYDKNITITTYDSFKSLPAENYDVMILDEVHEALTDKRKTVIASFKNALKLGFTATPDYSDYQKTEDLLKTQIAEVSILSAIMAGYLCPVKTFVVKTEFDLGSIKINETGDYNPAELNKAVNIETRNSAAVEIYKKYLDGKQGLVFCTGIDHAEKVAKRFRNEGISAYAVHSQMEQKLREELKEKFNRGEVKVLCNVNTLTRGADFPTAQFILNLAPTRSIVKETQSAGRALRIDPNKPNKIATVVDFLDKGSESNPPVIFGDVLLGEAELPDYIQWISEEVKTGENEVKEPVEIAGIVDVITSIGEVIEISKGRDLNPFQNWSSIPSFEILLNKKLGISVSSLYIKRAVEELSANPLYKEVFEAQTRRIFKAKGTQTERVITKFSPIIQDMVIEYFERIKEESDKYINDGWKTADECTLFLGITKSVFDSAVKVRSYFEGQSALVKGFDQFNRYREIEMYSPSLIEETITALYYNIIRIVSPKSFSKRVTFQDMNDYYNERQIFTKYKINKADFDILVVARLQAEIAEAIEKATLENKPKLRDSLEKIIVERINIGGKVISLFKKEQITFAMNKLGFKPDFL